MTIDTRQATDARQTTAPRFEASAAGVKQSPEEQVRHAAKMPVPDDVDPHDRGAMLAWATQTFGLIKTGAAFRRGRPDRRDEPAAARGGLQDVHRANPPRPSGPGLIEGAPGTRAVH